MSALIDHGDEDGRPLSDEKILLHLAKDLITCGIDTTTHLVGNLFYDLLTTPGAYTRVRDDRTLVPIAVEVKSLWLRWRLAGLASPQREDAPGPRRSNEILEAATELLGYERTPSPGKRATRVERCRCVNGPEGMFP